MHSNVARLGVEGARDISECGTLVAIFLSSGPLSLRRNATKIRGRGLVADDFCLVIAYTSCIMHYGFEDELFLSWGGLDSNDIWSKPRSRPLNNLWQIEFEVSVEIFSFFFFEWKKVIRYCYYSFDKWKWFRRTFWNPNVVEKYSYN